MVMEKEWLVKVKAVGVREVDCRVGVVCQRWPRCMWMTWGAAR
jgi:hypothetical protein